jgi:hypothetical protein
VIAEPLTGVAGLEDEGNRRTHAARELRGAARELRGDHLAPRPAGDCRWVRSSVTDAFGAAARCGDLNVMAKRPPRRTAPRPRLLTCRPTGVCPRNGPRFHGKPTPGERRASQRTHGRPASTLPSRCGHPKGSRQTCPLITVAHQSTDSLQRGCRRYAEPARLGCGRPERRTAGRARGHRRPDAPRSGHPRPEHATRIRSD